MTVGGRMSLLGSRGRCRGRTGGRSSLLEGGVRLIFEGLATCYLKTRYCCGSLSSDGAAGGCRLPIVGSASLARRCWAFLGARARPGKVPRRSWGAAVSQGWRPPRGTRRVRARRRSRPRPRACGAGSAGAPSAGAGVAGRARRSRSHAGPVLPGGGRGAHSPAAVSSSISRKQRSRLTVGACEQAGTVCSSVVSSVARRPMRRSTDAQ